MHGAVPFAKQSALAGSCNREISWCANSTNNELRPLPFNRTSWVVKASRTLVVAAFGVEELVPRQHVGTLQENNWRGRNGASAPPRAIPVPCSHAAPPPFGCGPQRGSRLRRLRRGAS